MFSADDSQAGSSAQPRGRPARQSPARPGPCPPRRGGRHIIVPKAGAGTEGHAQLDQRNRAILPPSGPRLHLPVQNCPRGPCCFLTGSVMPDGFCCWGGLARSCAKDSTDGPQRAVTTGGPKGVPAPTVIEMMHYWLLPTGTGLQIPVRPGTVSPWFDWRTTVPSTIRSLPKGGLKTIISPRVNRPTCLSYQTEASWSQITQRV